jgi:hypothetical protein
MKNLISIFLRTALAPGTAAPIFSAGEGRAGLLEGGVLRRQELALLGPRLYAWANSAGLQEWGIMLLHPDFVARKGKENNETQEELLCQNLLRRFPFAG